MLVNTVKASKRFVRNFSTLKFPCLTRDFINDRLYSPEGGYFCQENVQIGEISEPINFRELVGYDEYAREIAKKYPKNAWLTPSELFRPWYGFSLANYIVQTFVKAKKSKKTSKLKIIEVGAGSGSAADSILFYLKNYEAQHYTNVDYKIVEVSPQMCARATEKLAINHKKLLDKGQITVVNENILNYKGVDDSLTFVVFLEVLDNMPHDRIYYSDENKAWAYETWVNATVDAQGKETYEEIKRPIADPLIKELIEIYTTMPNKEYYEDMEKKGGIAERIVNWMYRPKDSKNLFIPTACLQMLKTVNKLLPNHHLIMADFDALRGSESVYQGLCSPIVSKKLEKSHEKEDYKSYLVGRGQADIFFPTNFYLLQDMYKKVTKRKGRFLKTHEFMDEFAKEKWCQTQSGYNPIKEDFLNTSIFFTESSA